METPREHPNSRLFTISFSTLKPRRPWCMCKIIRMEYKTVLIEKEAPLAVITLNRPQQLNALSYDLVKDLSLAMQELDRDEEVHVLIVTGGDKVFAAGADIKEMADRGPFDPRIHERLAYRDQINKISKPVIAAVSGFALGGSLSR